MANKKISELDSRASLSLSDLLAVGDPTTGYLYKITITDLKTLTGAGVISFNGRVGSVTPAEGDYNLTQLGDVIITSATNSQVLQFNGSNWVNATINLSGYVPYTGASTNVNLGTNTLLAAQIKATSSAGLSINANSGTQIADLGAGGGANMTLYGGLTGTTISLSSSATASSFIKTGGTSSQFLMADGSVNTNTYLQLSGGTLTGEVFFNVPIRIKHTTGLASPVSGYNSISADANGYYLASASLNFYAYLNISTLSNNRTFTLPDASGTIALTSQIPSLSGYIQGSGVSGRIPFYNGTGSITSDSSFNWDNTNKIASAGGFYVFNNTTNAYMLSSNGDNIGSVFNVSATKWALGYGTSQTTLATPVLTWDDSGRIGIGTTSPVGLLQLNGSIANSADAATFTIKQSSTSYTNGIYLERSGERTGYFMYISSANDALTFRRNWVGTQSDVMVLTREGNVGVNCTPNSQFEVLGTSGNPLTDGIRISRNTLQTSQYGVINYTSGILNITGVETSSGGEIRFNTSNGTTTNERVRINNVGNVGIATTGDPDIRLYIKGQDSSSAQFGFLFQNSNNNTLFAARNDGLINFGVIPSNAPYNLSTSGRSAVLNSAGSLGYLVSTRESKINIEPIDSIDFINKLNPVQFNYRKKNDAITEFTDEFYENITYGFIADEVEKVNKELVFYNSDGKTLAGVEYNSMIAILTKAVQEQQKQIEQLKAKLK